MSASLEYLASQAIGLAEEDRARLADLLLSSLPNEQDSEMEAAWEHEIRRHIDAIESGAARLVPSTEVHAQARQIFRK